MTLAGITDAYGKGPDHTDKMRGTAKLIVSMLRTWSGANCSGQMSPVRQLTFLLYHRLDVFLCARQASITNSSGWPSNTNPINESQSLTYSFDTASSLPFCSQEIILDMFFELFNIKPPEWHQAFLDGRRLTSEFYVLCVVFTGLTRVISVSTESNKRCSESRGRTTEQTRRSQTYRSIRCAVDISVL